MNTPYYKKQNGKQLCIILEIKDGKERGYVCADFESETDLDDVLSKLNKLNEIKEFSGKEITIDEAPFAYEGDDAWNWVGGYNAALSRINEK